MATGDILWKVIGARVTNEGWAWADQLQADQTTTLDQFTQAIPAPTTAYSFRAVPPLAVTTRFFHQNDGNLSFVKVPFDLNKKYTITITEE
jgi:hypothetical protein